MQPLTFFLGRLFLALYFLYAGYEKVISPSAAALRLQSHGIPYPKIAWVVFAAVEILGGLLLFLGARARAVGLLLAVYTILTAYYLYAHGPERMSVSFLLSHLAVAGGLLIVAAAGAGRFSLDRN
ncbi:MAG: DoxX family protein [Pseudomonadota bacterium]